MLVTGFPADAFGTNCYVVAPAAGEQCVIVDPGVGVADRLDDVLAAHRLHPVAVILTHGHLDHTFSVAPVCGAKGITAYLHPDDREMLADPFASSLVDLRALLGGLEWSEPDDVQPLSDGTALKLAGLEFTVDHAPGHTRGSVLFRLPGDEALTMELAVPGTGVRSGRSEAGELCFSGDVLFAGSIGRTDLPGGDMSMMLRSLRDKVLPLPDETLV
ncbi:MAG TPA: MBL fold metallo-hydrolase, partial [Micromonosporaceae bacterium]|nr:MBL fold metallo-hydrolase [Micromonosporaceae bacterium]